MDSAIRTSILEEKQGRLGRFDLARIWFELREIPIPETAWGSMSCRRYVAAAVYFNVGGRPTIALQITANQVADPVSATPENCGEKKMFDLTDKLTGPIIRAVRPAA